MPACWWAFAWGGDRVVRQALAHGGIVELVPKGDMVSFLYFEGLLLMRSATYDGNQVLLSPPLADGTRLLLAASLLSWRNARVSVLGGAAPAACRSLRGLSGSESVCCTPPPVGGGLLVETLSCIGVDRCFISLHRGGLFSRPETRGGFLELPPRSLSPLRCPVLDLTVYAYTFGCRDEEA